MVKEGFEGICVIKDAIKTTAEIKQAMAAATTGDDLTPSAEGDGGADASPTAFGSTAGFACTVIIALAISW